MGVQALKAEGFTKSGSYYVKLTSKDDGNPKPYKVFLPLRARDGLGLPTTVVNSDLSSFFYKTGFHAAQHGFDVVYMCCFKTNPFCVGLVLLFCASRFSASRHGRAVAGRFCAYTCTHADVLLSWQWQWPIFNHIAIIIRWFLIEVA